MKKNIYKSGYLQDVALKIFSYLFTGLFALFCILPIMEIVSVSLSDEKLINLYGYSILPRGLTFDTYRFIFSDGFDWIIRSYMNTFFVVTIGTVSAVIITSMLAFTISSNDVKYRMAISIYSYIPMIFSAGLVPFYIVCVKTYGFSNRLYALILPYLVNMWFLFILKRFFMTIPNSLKEAARIDGASPLRVFFNIVMPLSKTAILTIGLFYLLQYWNDWWLALLFLRKSELHTLQYQLFNLLANSEIINSFQTSGGIKVNVPRETVKMAVTVITIGPVIFFYPFIQKYFIKGIMIGAVKG